MVGPTINFRLKNRDFNRKLSERADRARGITFKSFRDEALFILKETALELVQHRYIGNTVGGYYQGLDFETKKFGFALVANAPYSSEVESGTGPRYSSDKPFIFRGRYANPRIINKLYPMLARRRVARIRAQARAGAPINVKKLTNKPKTTLAREQQEHEARTHFDLQEQVARADRRIRGELGTPMEEFNAARRMSRNEIGNKSQYPYGIYTVFSRRVKGYQGLHVLREAGKRIFARAKSYFKKRATLEMTGRKTGYTIGG